MFNQSTDAVTNNCHNGLKDVISSFIKVDDDIDDDDEGSFDMDQSAASDGLPSFNGSKMFAKRN